VSCKVVTDDEGKSKGFGSVHFETKEAARSAIEKVNGNKINDQVVYVFLSKPLFVALWQPRANAFDASRRRRPRPKPSVSNRSSERTFTFAT